MLASFFWEAVLSEEEEDSVAPDEELDADSLAAEEEAGAAEEDAATEEEAGAAEDEAASEVLLEDEAPPASWPLPQGISEPR